MLFKKENQPAADSPAIAKPNQPKVELTTAGKTYEPVADIFETKSEIVLVMDMPGVGKDNVEVGLDENVLTVKGSVNLAKIKALEPVYSEHNIGNYQRRFAISEKIDRGNISATVVDGVLTVTLPKSKDLVPKKIQIT